jgi:ribose-phosphate pyrophosphokinase
LDDIVLLTGTAHPELAREIGGHLGIQLAKREIFKFKNGNTFVRIRENVRRRDVFVIQPSCEPVNDGLMELLILIDALTRASARSVTVLMPYFAYSRSDKKDQPRIPITASLVAKLLEAAGADRVITVDLHAPQIQGFFQIPTDQLLALPTICAYVRTLDLENPVAVAPDAGSAKTTRGYAKRLGFPLALVDKRRRGNEDSIEDVVVIGDVKGCDCVIFDDEVSTGGSLCTVVDALKANGARRVYAAVTHPVLCGGAPDRIENSELEALIVTNSLPVPPAKREPKIVVLSIAETLAEAIRRVQLGTSVSELFERREREPLPVEA